MVIAFPCLPDVAQAFTVDPNCEGGTFVRTEELIVALGMMVWSCWFISRGVVLRLMMVQSCFGLFD